MPAFLGIDLIGVPFDGWGRVGHQGRAAEALRAAGLLAAFDDLPVRVHDTAFSLPEPFLSVPSGRVC